MRGPTPRTYGRYVVRHLSEQYFTCSQSRSHFLRQAKGRPHAMHIFVGRLGFLWAMYTNVGRSILAACIGWRSQALHRRMTILIPVLGDQLSQCLASLRDVAQGNAVVLLMEVAEETTYVRHHKRKIILVLSAMRHFAEELRASCWTVDYVRLDDPDNSGSFTGEIARAILRHQPEAIRVVEPGEWRVKVMIDDWQRRFGLPVDILPDDWRNDRCRKRPPGWT